MLSGPVPSSHTAEYVTCSALVAPDRGFDRPVFLWRCFVLSYGFNRLWKSYVGRKVNVDGKGAGTLLYFGITASTKVRYVIEPHR